MTFQTPMVVLADLELEDDINARCHRTDEGIEELKASIRAHGLAQSLRQTLRCDREDAHRRRQPPLSGALRTGGIRRHRRWRHRHRKSRFQ
jgi:hypothetical protein